MDDASPRFRQDLEASVTEADGVACVDVRDPKSGTSFRFYDFEYQLALQLTGQPLSAVSAWASEAYGVDLTADGIKEFAGRLRDLGFLEPREGAGGVGDLTPARGTSAPDGLDSAEAEWMTTEGAQTATFVPDPGMLDSHADRTPVAPELPTLDGVGDHEGEERESISSDARPEEATPVPEAASPPEVPAAPTPPPRLFDIPMPAANPPAAASEVPTAPSLPAVRSFASRGLSPSPRPAASWAQDLEGKLASDAATPVPTAEAPPPAQAPAPRPVFDAGNTLTPPPLLKPPPGPPPAAVPPPPKAGPAPAGLPERRQPPTPEAVQMTPFAAEPAAAAAKAKRSGAGRIVALVILALVIVGVVYFGIMRERARIPQAAARVRVFSPKPAAVYRWFSGRGTVTDREARVLAFESAGMLAELLPPGTSFAAGDILGRLRAAPPMEANLARVRARLAFYEQMRDSMRKANNQAELRQAEIKLADKRRLIDEMDASLAKVVVRATEPGEVVETLAKVGMPVRANAPMLRVKGRVLHGEFEIDPHQTAGKVAFCRVEVIGLGPHASNAEPAAGTAADVGSPDAQQVPRFVDCAFLPSDSDGPKLKVRVTLPDNLGLVPGQPLRLARARFDGVFPVPAAAIGGAGAGDRRSVWIASAAGTAERREVVVADVGDDALVSEGLRVGDEIIVDAPATLQPGAPIAVER